MSEGSLLIENVYATLQASLSQDNATRSNAEAQLSSWEKHSAPGLFTSLLKIAMEVQNIGEDSRLLAIVVAKNAVGSSWRKTVGTREWSHVPDEEKLFVRNTALTVLLQDPSQRVALQAALLITNIARFDAPRPWSTLLPDLANASLIDGPVPIESKHRALQALKHIIRALRSKRFVVGNVLGKPIRTREELDSLGNQIDSDRHMMIHQVKDLLGILRSQWEANFMALIQKQQGWDVRGQLAVDGLAAMREIFVLLPDFEGIENEFHAFMTEGAQAAHAIAGPLFSSTSTSMSSPSISGSISIDARDTDPYLSLLSKCWERIMQSGIISMERHPLLFAQHIPAWVNLCINTALLGMDASVVHSIRAKSRMLLTRFVGRALIQPHYKGDSAMDDPGLFMMSSANKERFRAAAPALDAAASCLNDMVSPNDNRCAALVEAIVSKYIILSDQEIEEWENDPEGFARQVDVETSPDAETPRPCGVALLECMMERSEEGVTQCLVHMASAMQSQPLTVEGVFPREAVYRAVGECFQYLRPRVDFKSWYAGELRNILAAPMGSLLEGRGDGSGGGDGRRNMALLDSVLRARALWLIGVCGEELEPEAWTDAFSLSVMHIAASPDVVVSLMAVSAVTAMIAMALDEQQFMSPENQRSWLGEDIALHTMGEEGGGQNGRGQDASREAIFTQANAEFQSHISAVDVSTDAIMNGCFSLLPRLTEAESMVRVLQCVSATVELMGDRIAPHLGSITRALPHVWSVLSSRTGDGGKTGASARLHCSLLAMLAHLIHKLGKKAAEDSNVSSVLPPLLHHATDVAAPDTEPLIDDGLKLWLSLLTAMPVLSAPLCDLAASRLATVLQRGKENSLAFKIAESYVLHMGNRTAATAAALSAMVASLLPQFAASIATTLDNVFAAMQPKPHPVASNARIPGSLSLELAQESNSALSLLVTLQRIYSQRNMLPPELELPIQKAARIVCADYSNGGSVVRLPDRSISTVESALEVVYRLSFASPGIIAQLTGGDMNAQKRLIERWIALSSMRDIGEVFIPSLGVMGRVRRHNGAVTLCALIVSDAVPALKDEAIALKAVVFGLAAAKEQRPFARDQQRLAELKPADPEHLDQMVLLKSLLAREDLLRTVDAVDAVRAAIGHITGWIGQERLMSALDTVDPLCKSQLKVLMAGQLPEEEENAAIAEMQHARLS